MTKPLKIPSKLRMRLNLTSPITRLALGLDGRLSRTDRIAFAQVAAEIRLAGRPLTLKEIYRVLGLGQRTARRSVPRLCWTGYLRADELLLAPDKTTLRLGMPFKSRLELDIPREPSLADTLLRE